MAYSRVRFPTQTTSLIFEHISILISTLLLIFNTLWPTSTVVTNIGLILVIVASSLGTIALKLPRERGYRVAATIFAVLAALLFIINGVAMAVLPIFIDCRAQLNSSLVSNACSYVTLFLIVALTVVAYGSITSVLLSVRYIRFCRSTYHQHLSLNIPTSIVVMPRSLCQKYDATKIELPPPIDLMPSPPPYSQHEFNIGSNTSNPS